MVGDQISSERQSWDDSPTRRSRIAVIIPCYNDGAFVGEAASSVQELDDTEVVVVDDGSTDPDTQRVLDYLAGRGVTILRLDNAGPAAARMAGVGATTAPYVFNLDADDVGVSSTLELMADRLDADGDASVCYGDYQEFGDSELTRLVPPTIDPYRLAYTNEYPVTALFRRSALEAVGGWRHIDESRQDYEDWHLWMTLAEHGHRGVHIGPGVLTFRKRMHGQRRLGAAKANHHAVYRTLRESHPDLFGKLAAYRRASNLSWPRKLLYPVLYGGRRRFPFEARVKGWLDRAGIWTLRG